MGTDIVSSGELYTAKIAGFDLSKAFFHGNSKTDQDISFAMDCGLGYFVADNREEIDAIDLEAGKRGITQKVLLRLSPGIDSHTFEAVVTGRVDSKFGTAIATGQADEIIEYTLGKKNICLEGLHCHIGSQIFDIKPFCDTADLMLTYIAHLKEKFGYITAKLNLGGGFGVKYTSNDPEIDYAKNIKEIASHVKAKCQEFSVAMPDIIMEPGRSLVADSGMTLYTVGSVKEITGYKNYVSIDGGMTDNPRYALYSSPYTVFIANKMDKQPNYTATIAGRCCESGDMIQEGVLIPKATRGDILAVAVTGAYNYSMASNYNKVPRPAVVFVNGENDYVAIKRETFADLMKNDI
jgi:diaminopimelate decarboxylase